MTDEQLKSIASGVIDLGDAIRNIGLALWPIPPMPPPIDPPPVDPPPVEPPPTGESAFMRAVVLDAEFPEKPRMTVPGGPVVDPDFNPFGKSFGLSFTFQYNAPPNMASPLSLRNDENPFFQLFARGPTALGVVFAKTIGGWADIDVVVDDMVGRRVSAFVSYDYSEGTANLWVDGVLRGVKAIPNGIGIYHDKTPPLIINSTAAGHQSGDITPIRLVYAVGAAPTQADVDALSGIVPKPPGFSNGVTDGTIWAEANGEGFADLPLHDPSSWIDGRNVTMKQTVNNPPLRKRYEAPIPQDVGREVK
jgi:hypothetical protein